MTRPSLPSLPSRAKVGLRLALAGALVWLLVLSCRTVVSSGPSPLDSTVEGVRTLDGGWLEVVWPDGGTLAMPQSAFAQPYCDARANPRIPFPAELRDAGLVGEVQVKCTVELTGLQSDCVLLQGVGEPMDTVVFQTVKTWRCVPARVTQVPVRAAHVAFVRFGTSPSAPQTSPTSPTSPAPPP